MKKKVLLLFVKNIKLGKVKSRLAKTIGDEGALELYKELLAITEKAIATLEVDKIVYFSEAIEDSTWSGAEKKVQFGENLGERMQNAFTECFNLGYESVVLIGSDLPEISREIILEGFEALLHSETVFGPAQDGGYYLIGMNRMHASVFENKPWSEPQLLEVTLSELKQNNSSFSLLQTLNDIDTYEDLESADFFKNDIQLQQKIKQYHER